MSAPAIAPGAVSAPNRAAPGALTYNDTSHVYMLEGRRLRSITAIAKIPTDTFTVDQWRMRQVALGLAIDPTLIEDVAAHRDDNHRVNDIVQKAMDIAGASNASRRGTQAHAASEYHDLNQPLITDQQRRDAAVWQRTLDAYGIEVIPRFVEQIVCYPTDLVAGRTDRFARMDGSLFDFDIKTGTSAWRYPHGTAVQLALHVNAPWIQQGSRIVDGIETVTEWEPLPEELRRDVAYVIAMPTRDSGEDIGTLYRFQLEGRYAGTVAAKMALVARHFQMNDSLATRVNPPLRPAQFTAADHEVSIGEVVDLLADVLPVKAAFDATAPGAQQVIVDRIMGLADVDKARLRGMWAACELPSIGSIMPVDALVRAWELVDEVDPWLTVAPAPELAPASTAPARRIFPKPEDGPIAPTDETVKIADMYARLPESVLIRIGDLSGEATRNGVDFHLGQRATARRLDLLRGLIALAVNDCADDGSLRHIVSGITGEPVDDASDVGALVGSLNVEQAATFVHIADQWAIGRVGCHLDTEGRAVLTIPNP